MTKQEKQLHFRVPMWVFEEYEKEAQRTGVMRGVAEIRADLVRQATILRNNRLAEEAQLTERPMTAYEELQMLLNEK